MKQLKLLSGSIRNSLAIDVILVRWIVSTVANVPRPETATLSNLKEAALFLLNSPSSSPICRISEPFRPATKVYSNRYLFNPARNTYTLHSRLFHSQDVVTFSSGDLIHYNRGLYNLVIFRDL